MKSKGLVNAKVHAVMGIQEQHIYLHCFGSVSRKPMTDVTSKWLFFIAV